MTHTYIYLLALVVVGFLIWRNKSREGYREVKKNNGIIKHGNKCQVSDWSEWSGCGFDNQKIREREITKNGKDCPELTETESCTRLPLQKVSLATPPVGTTLIDAGYNVASGITFKRGMVDLLGDGKQHYCRHVGQSSNPRFSCYDPQTGTQNIHKFITPAFNWNYYGSAVQNNFVAIDPNSSDKKVKFCHPAAFPDNGNLKCSVYKDDLSGFKQEFQLVNATGAPI